MGTRVRSYATQCAQGEGWSRSFTYRVDNAAETPIDLAGARVEFYLYDQEGTEAIAYDVSEDGAASDAVVFDDAADGQFTVTIAGTETAALEAHRHTMELWVTVDGGEPARLIPPPPSATAAFVVTASRRS
jgi:anti-sigma-K factor RskA